MSTQPDGFRFTEVLRQELNFLRPDQAVPAEPTGSQNNPDDIYKQGHAADFAGLAFSGGGIRSATFNLGVIQALAKSGPSPSNKRKKENLPTDGPQFGLLPLFDYLSTVSGGGYIGSWFSAWLYREKEESGRQLSEFQEQLSTHPCRSDREPFDGRDCANRSGISQPNTSGFPPLEHAAIRHLRRYSNYLSPRIGMSGDLLAIVSLFLRNLVVLQLCLILLAAAVLLTPYIFTSYSIYWINQNTVTPMPNGTMFLLGFVPLIVAMRIWCWQFRDLPEPPDSGPKLSAWREELRRKQKASVWWMGLSIGLLPVTFWLMITGLIPLLVEHQRLDHEMPRYFILLYAAVYMFAWSLSPGPISPTANRDNQIPGKTIKRIVIALAAAFVFGCLIHFSAIWIDAGNVTAAGRRVFVTAIGSPAVLLILSFTIALQLGLGRNLYQERERERWARVGGLVLLAAGIWLAIFFFSAYAPPLVSWLGKGGLAVLAGWASASGLGAWIARKTLDLGNEQGIPWKVVTIRAVPWFFLTGFAVFLSFGLSKLVNAISLGHQIGDFRSFGLPSDLPLSVEFVVYTMLFEFVSLNEALLLFGLVVAMFLVISWRLDLNIFSAHAIYRNRLVRAYLGASNLKKRNAHPISGFDPRDDLQLADLKQQRPVPIINTTINMTGGDDLAWQTRRAASFTFTPTFVGFEAKSSRGIDFGGYRKVTQYGTSETYISKRKKGLTNSNEAGISLGTAMAISGAAASPNMGRFTSTSLSALLTVFNLRTGFWAGNPRMSPRSGNNGINDKHGKAQGKLIWEFLPAWRRKRPVFSAWPLIAELAGSANAESNWISLSDGGHFENLGIYELIRRRCRFIVVVDAGCDPAHQFQDLANAIRKCWTDFGVHIFFPDLDRVRLDEEGGGLCEAHGTIGVIEYPDQSRVDNVGARSDQKPYGLILYLKCSLTEHEMKNYTDIRQYAEVNSNFPHEPTSDQFFDEDQFEAYRHLGYCVGQWSRPLIEMLTDKQTLRLNARAIAEKANDIVENFSG